MTRIIFPGETLNSNKRYFIIFEQTEHKTKIGVDSEHILSASRIKDDCCVLPNENVYLFLDKEKVSKIYNNSSGKLFFQIKKEKVSTTKLKDVELFSFDIFDVNFYSNYLIEVDGFAEIKFFDDIEKIKNVPDIRFQLTAGYLFKEASNSKKSEFIISMVNDLDQISKYNLIRYIRNSIPRGK